jgi:uncharacterized RDD family membrane protein YckC
MTPPPYIHRTRPPRRGRSALRLPLAALILAVLAGLAAASLGVL